MDNFNVAPTSRENAPNPLRDEHLNPGIKPIRASLETSWNSIDEVAKGSDFESVNFYGSKKDFKENDQLNNGSETYVISRINERPKKSHNYRNCTGIIVVGIDKETGKEISFMTHQNPESFLPFYKTSKYMFDKDLGDKMEEMKGRVVPGTLDVVLFGGNIKGKGAEYQKSIGILHDLSTQHFGFEPVVIDGPSIKEDIGEYTGANAYFETSNRRLFIGRDIGDAESSTRQSYTASQSQEEIARLKRIIELKNKLL